MTSDPAQFLHGIGKTTSRMLYTASGTYTIPNLCLDRVHFRSFSFITNCTYFISYLKNYTLNH